VVRVEFGKEKLRPSKECTQNKTTEIESSSSSVGIPSLISERRVVVATAQHCLFERPLAGDPGWGAFSRTTGVLFPPGEESAVSKGTVDRGRPPSREGKAGGKLSGRTISYWRCKKTGRENLLFLGGEHRMRKDVPKIITHKYMPSFASTDFQKTVRARWGGGWWASPSGLRRARGVAIDGDSVPLTSSSRDERTAAFQKPVARTTRKQKGKKRGQARAE